MMIEIMEMITAIDSYDGNFGKYSDDSDGGEVVMRLQKLHNQISLSFEVTSSESSQLKQRTEHTQSHTFTHIHTPTHTHTRVRARLEQFLTFLSTQLESYRRPAPPR